MTDDFDKDTGEPGLESGGHGASSGGFRLRHFVIIAAVAVAAGAAFYIWHRSTSVEPPPEAPEGVTVVPEGSRTVTLFFAEKNDEALIPETRLVAVGKDLAEQVRQVMHALLAGPEGDAVSTIAEGTRLIGAFYDAESAVLYLDFSSELVAGHPGGASAEYYTIAAIVRTVAENFPEVRAVQLLIEGLQVGTIAGHIDANQPFLVRDWR
jgi:spore germination protein GerM